MHPYDHSSQDLETAQAPSVDEWMLQKAVVHLHDGILHRSKKEGTLTF